MKKVLLFLFATSLIWGLSSCKKKGCTDSKATNYDSKAKKDDGSCVFPVVEPQDDNTNEEISINSNPLYYFKIDGNVQDSRTKQNVVQINDSGSDYMESDFYYGSNPSQVGVQITREGLANPSTLTNSEIEAYFAPGIYSVNDFRIGGIKDNGQTFSSMYSSLDQSGSQFKIVESQATTLNGQFAIKVYIEFNCNTAATSGNWTEKLVTDGKIVTYFQVQ